MRKRAVFCPFLRRLGQFFAIFAANGHFSAARPPTTQYIDFWLAFNTHLRREKYLAAPQKICIIFSYVNLKMLYNRHFEL